MPTRSSGPRRPDGWDAAVVGYALLAALCRPLTLPAALAVLLPGIVLVAVRARRAPADGAAVRWPAVVPWAALVLVACVWELVAVLWGNDADRPTLSLLLDPVLDTYPGRLAGYVGWLAAGRWLVTR